jgi:hypothetical protein
MPADGATSNCRACRHFGRASQSHASLARTNRSKWSDWSSLPRLRTLDPFYAIARDLM